MKSDIYSKEHARLIKRLILARQKAGLNQIEAARRLGRSQSYISKIEVGQRKIDVMELKRFAKMYNVSIHYFF